MKIKLDDGAILPTRRKRSSVMIGEKIGLLTVIEEVASKNRNLKMYLCHCDCGNDVIRSTRYLHRKEQAYFSCGCMSHWASKKHGFSKSGERLYRIWQAMRWRANENNHSYETYRKNNIKCCSEWNDYATFRKWALENGYDDHLTLDRIDNNGDYTPENCRWADHKTQANNKSSNTLVTVNNEIKTISEWADEKNINYSTLRSRVNRQHITGEQLFASCELRRDETTGRFIGGYEQ